jgi:hypothetical protein
MRVSLTVALGTEKRECPGVAPSCARVGEGSRVIADNQSFGSRRPVDHPNDTRIFRERS